MSKTRELVEVLKEHIGKLQINGDGSIHMCLGSVDGGLRWKLVLTSDQLWDAIEAAKSENKLSLGV